MVIPPVDFEDLDYSDMITSYFSGKRVEEDDIEILKQEQRDALHSVIDDLSQNAKARMEEIEASIEKAKNEFVDSLVGNLKASSEQLAAAVREKAVVCERWKQHIKIVEDAKVRLA